jgi:hypothetical protein
MKNATDYVGGDKSYKSRTTFCNDDDDDTEEQEWEKGKKYRKLTTTVLRYKNGNEMTEKEQIRAKTRRK